MKEFKKMFIINGINVSEEEFNSVVDFFNQSELLPKRIYTDTHSVVTNCTNQTVDKFTVEITTYYFNYFGKFIEIGQQVVSFK